MVLPRSTTSEEMALAIKLTTVFGTKFAPLTRVPLSLTGEIDLDIAVDIGETAIHSTNQDSS